MSGPRKPLLPPGERERLERYRAWAATPEARKLRETARRLAHPKVDLAPPPAPPPSPSKPKRKQGGGRKPIFTADEIAERQEIVCREVIANPKLRKLTEDEAVKYFKPLFKLGKRKVGDDTLWNLIIRPILRPEK
jgi:hypothetical protein